MTIIILDNSGLKLEDLNFLQLCLKKRLSYVLYTAYDSVKIIYRNIQNLS